MTEEQKKLVLDNGGLVRHLIQKLPNPPSTTAQYEEFVSVGTMGLIKASVNFDSSKGFKFSTFAARCIYNELFHHFRHIRKHATDLSFDTPIAKNDKNEFHLEDIIADPTDFVQNFEVDQRVSQILSTIFKLPSRERSILLSHIGGLTQIQIAERSGLSQGYISKLLKASSLNLQQRLQRQHVEDHQFSLSYSNGFIVVTFKPEQACFVSKGAEKFLLFCEIIAPIPNEFGVVIIGDTIQLQIPGFEYLYLFSDFLDKLECEDIFKDLS